MFSVSERTLGICWLAHTHPVHRSHPKVGRSVFRWVGGWVGWGGVVGAMGGVGLHLIDLFAALLLKMIRGGRERGFPNGIRFWIPSQRMSLSISGGTPCCGGRSSPRRLSTGRRMSDGWAGLLPISSSSCGCARAAEGSTATGVLLKHAETGPGGLNERFSVKLQLAETAGAIVRLHTGWPCSNDPCIRQRRA